jgi:2-keto-4-pentenoate hydratase/2-oxohepta-3-ene-1,7-dioic acid hydratase in catechol pathway
MMTGTPPGVGYGMKPQQYLKPGDIMEAQIEKLGAQRNIIVASRQ